MVDALALPIALTPQPPAIVVYVLLIASWYLSSLYLKSLKASLQPLPSAEPGNENGHPRRLDHFVFKRKTLRGQDVAWVPVPEIAQAHGEKPTELGIIFLNDDPREVFRTEYALWTPDGCKCRGELVQIMNGGGPRFEMQATRKK
jgi:recombination directionality factor gp3-like protein